MVITDGGSIKAVKNKPDLKWNEISIGLQIEVPAQLFQKPRIEATLVIPESAAGADAVEADVRENVREAIEQATGLEVRLSVQPPEGAE